MSKGWERFFFIFTYFTQGAHYLSPRSYAILHRSHHAYADTEKDPHSPKYFPNMMSLMWATAVRYHAVVVNKAEVEERFTKNLPEWPAFEKWANSNFSRLLWIGVYVAIFIKYTTSPWEYLFLPVIIAMGPVHGAIINWYAHKYGYINFKVGNTSRNLFFIDILMLGEAYHNNHHKQPSSSNFGRRWHEIDPIYIVIRVLAFLGIVKLNKTVPLPVHSTHEDKTPENNF